MVTSSAHSVREYLILKGDSYKRSRHLEERMAERVAELNSEPVIERSEQAPATDRMIRSTELWSDEELRILKEIEERYAGNRFINLKIAGHLPLKSNKKVSNKRAQLRVCQIGHDGVGDPPNDSVHPVASAINVLATVHVQFVGSPPLEGNMPS
jgi:hypothetical protein